MTTDTLRLLAALRIEINAHVTAAERALAERWILAWDQLAADWREAAEQVVEAWADGRPSAYQIERLDRVQRALAATAQEFDRLREFAIVTVTNGAGDVIDMSAERLAEIMASQMPSSMDRAALTAAFNRLDPEALRAIVLRATEQIASSSRQLSARAIDAMYRALISGIGLGDNPRQVARMMLRLERGFNGGLDRALNLARTEMLDAHREAARVHRQANADTLRGWRWLATLDERTCPSCLAKNGTEYPVGTFGPIDHQQGRCASVPVVKPWRELGLPDVIEPPDVFPDAREWFAGLPAATQLRIMGAERLAWLQSGAISWDDLSVLRQTNGWRESFGVRPLYDLRMLARRAA